MTEFFKRNYLYVLIALTLVSMFVTVFSVLKPPTSAYYVIDPDPAYVANALEYLQIHKIFILDHPGTTLIMALSMVFLPIKIAVKLLGTSTFMEWSVRNFEALMWLGKFVTFSFFTAGLFIFHISIYKLFKSLLTNIFLTFLLFLIPYFVFLQTIITPETTALFFAGVWFYFMTQYVKTDRYDYLAVGAVFSGLATASKINFLFLMAPSLIVTAVGWLRKRFNKVETRKVLMVIGLSLSGFVLGTLPVIRHYGYIINWTFNLITKTGRTGSGPSGIADLSIFLNSFSNLFGRSEIIFVFTVILVLFLFASKVHLFWKSLLASSLFGLFAFMKYAQVHYQFANFIMLALFLVFIFSVITRKLKLLALAITIPFSLTTARVQTASVRKDVVNAAAIQSFRDTLPENGFFIWQDSASEDFALERALDWSSNFFRAELKEYRPNTWILYYMDYRIIINNDRQYYSIDDFCWDGLFLVKGSWADFIRVQKNPENYVATPIEGSEVLFVTKKSCSSKGLQPEELKNPDEYEKYQ